MSAAHALRLELSARSSRSRRTATTPRGTSRGRRPARVTRARRLRREGCRDPRACRRLHVRRPCVTNCAMRRASRSGRRATSATAAHSASIGGMPGAASGSGGSARALGVGAGEQVAEPLRARREGADERGDGAEGEPELEDADECADERVAEARRAAVDADDAAADRRACRGCARGWSVSTTVGITTMTSTSTTIVRIGTTARVDGVDARAATTPPGEQQRARDAEHHVDEHAERPQEVAERLHVERDGLAGEHLVLVDVDESRGASAVMGTVKHMDLDALTAARREEWARLDELSRIPASLGRRGRRARHALPSGIRRSRRRQDIGRTQHRRATTSRRMLGARAAAADRRARERPAPDPAVLRAAAARGAVPRALGDARRSPSASWRSPTVVALWVAGDPALVASLGSEAQLEQYAENEFTELLQREPRGGVRRHGLDEQRLDRRAVRAVRHHRGVAASWCSCRTRSASAPPRRS